MAVRVAAVGCGYWGPNVIRNLDSVPGFDLCWVCDADLERLKSVAARYPSVPGRLRAKSTSQRTASVRARREGTSTGTW